MIDINDETVDSIDINFDEVLKKSKINLSQFSTANQSLVVNYEKSDDEEEKN